MTAEENRKRNVFVLGSDPAHLAHARDIPDADRFAFHELLRAEELIHLERYPMDELLDRARAILDAFDGPVDAIIGHWDFPVSVMVPILCAERGLKSPSLTSVLKCEHKYWSRLEQRKVVPECTPAFCAIDPFAARPIDQLRVDFPFWLKPVKAYGSALGFRVNDGRDFDRAIEAARKGIRRFGDPVQPHPVAREASGGLGRCGRQSSVGRAVRRGTRDRAGGLRAERPLPCPRHDRHGASSQP